MRDVFGMAWALAQVLFFGGFAFYFGGGVIPFGSEVSVEVLSHINTHQNAKVVELKIKNESQVWKDYTAMGSKVKIYSNDFSIIDEDGRMLEADGRTEPSIIELGRGKYRVINVVFVDEDNRIEDFVDLEIDSNDLSLALTLPEAEYVESDLELLSDMFFNKDADKDKIAKELRKRAESQMVFKSNGDKEQSEEEEDVEEEEKSHNRSETNGYEVYEKNGEYFVSGITLGMDISEVETILGEPDLEEGNESYWYEEGNPDHYLVVEMGNTGYIHSIGVQSTPGTFDGIYDVLGPSMDSGSGPVWISNANQRLAQYLDMPEYDQIWLSYNE
ncbi:hypothetical protein SM124_13190 [Bacillus sp. 31A1R]|uniref:Uncharacterized protein n=1 Tax=Robertmurraya mangrovi TaxID=3098077 RepID=A0ABU5J014_9BACI|nr:hypothetical protein [Bacillus sp. 31A1R]MDZ5472687.1 hypothetical protein [Bacillus sp. 31A1R]